MASPKSNVNIASLNMSNNKEKLESIATDVLSYQELPKDKFGSVIMILMMVSIIVGAIRVLQECDKGRSIKNPNEHYLNKVREISDRRWWFARMRLKKIMRKELSREDYKEYSASLCDAIFLKGESITEEEIKTLLEAK